MHVISYQKTPVMMITDRGFIDQKTCNRMLY